MRAECYVCRAPIDLTVPSFPFCGPAHHAEWADKHYGTPEQVKKRGKTLEDAITRCRELGGNRKREVAL
jgi:hypothetical protein